MSEQRQSDEQLIQYLLGSLPETETESLDALSFTDAEFAHRLSAAEKDLVDAYVRGELTGTALERFQSHYLLSARRKEKVEFAQAFQVLAEKISPVIQPTQRRTDKLTERSPATSSLTSLFPISRLWAPWGLTALALVLIASGGWVLWERSHRKEPAVDIAIFTLRPQLREVGQLPTITVPAGATQVAMNLELEPNDYQIYHVVLLDRSDQRTLWQSDKLKASDEGSGPALRVRFPAQLLGSRTFLLRVQGISPRGDPEILGDYPFVVK